MAVARWKIIRTENTVTSAIDTDMFINQKTFDECFQPSDPSMRHHDACTALHQTAPGLHEFYERSIARFHRAYIDPAHLGLNDFRMDLLNYVKANGGLDGVPTGMHGVVPADPERGLPPGVIFALRNRHDGINLNQLNRLHPYYLAYVGDRGEVIVPHTDVKRLLDLVRTACKGCDEPIPEAYQPLNRKTQDGREMQCYSGLLSQAIRSIADSKEEKDLDTLFTGPKTTALVDPIAGLDDFELIAFLIVQDAGRPPSAVKNG